MAPLSSRSRLQIRSPLSYGSNAWQHMRTLTHLSLPRFVLSLPRRGWTSSRFVLQPRQQRCSGACYIVGQTWQPAGDATAGFVGYGSANGYGFVGYRLAWVGKEKSISVCTLLIISPFRFALQNPEMFKCDLYGMAAFKQLEADPEHVEVFQLLNIMLSGDLKGLQSFVKEHASALAACNIAQEQAMLKTRLMALLALGEQQQGLSSVLTFDQIRDALSISEEDVEEWIVIAIGKKLIQGKIDQLHRRVQITRCTQRTFEPAQWMKLRTQLAVWTANLSNVADMVAAAQLDGSVQA